MKTQTETSRKPAKLTDISHCISIHILPTFLIRLVAVTSG